MLNFGVIGYGYWGPNVVRNLLSIEGIKVHSLCDQNPQALKKFQNLSNISHLTTDPDEIIKSPAIDIVAIITPVSTHYKLAKSVLMNGKHVFIEKPFTSNLKEAEELTALAKKKKLTIMVDHVFLFTGAVRKIKELIEQKDLGKLYYYDSLRSSLGLFRHDANVIWDLVPHDFSIIDYVIPYKPVAVSAQGIDHMGRGQENMAYITVYFQEKFMAHISVNWLSPVKIRTVLIGAEKKMLVWDDLQTDEKIKVYDRGVTLNDKEGRYRLMVDYRSGDMWSPHVDLTEALKLELEHFVKCLKTNQQPINDGDSGLRVMHLLSAAAESLKKKGKVIKL